MLLNIASAPVLISTNKIVLKMIPCPTLLTSLHYIVTYLLTLLTTRSGSGTQTTKSKMPILTLGNRVMVAMLLSCSPTIHNFALSKSPVGSSQLMKILTVPVTLTLEYVLFGKKITITKALVLSVACYGVYLSCMQDVALTLDGAAWSLLAVPFSAGHKIVSSFVLRSRGCTVGELMLELYPLMMMVGLLSPFTDPWNVFSADAWQGMGPKFAAVVAVNLSSSYMVSMSAFWVLGSNSALTHVLIGCAPPPLSLPFLDGRLLLPCLSLGRWLLVSIRRQCKTVVLLMVDALVFGVPTSPAKAMGAAIAISAMCVYTCINLASSQGGTAEGAAGAKAKGR